MHGKRLYMHCIFLSRLSCSVVHLSLMLGHHQQICRCQFSSAKSSTRSANQTSDEITSRRAFDHYTLLFYAMQSRSIEIYHCFLPHRIVDGTILTRSEFEDLKAYPRIGAPRSHITTYLGKWSNTAKLVCAFAHTYFHCFLRQRSLGLK